MVCTSENMGEHVQMAWNVRLQRRLAALHIIWLWFVSFYFRLNFLLSHAVDEVSVSEVPADRLWFLCFQNLLHHFRPATMLLRDYHLVYVQNYNVLESEIYISRWWKTFYKSLMVWSYLKLYFHPNRSSPVHVSVKTVIVWDKLILTFVLYSMFQEEILKKSEREKISVFLLSFNVWTWSIGRLGWEPGRVRGVTSTLPSDE